VSQEAVNADRRNVPTREGARHDRAVARTVELPDAAAARGEYVDALAQLHALEEIGHQLDSVYDNKRERLRLKVKIDRGGCSQWFAALDQSSDG
jgi:hypothetical protein